MVDSFSLLTGRISTHADKHACDSILVSDAIAQGLGGLKLESVTIQQHRHRLAEEQPAVQGSFPRRAFRIGQ